MIINHLASEQQQQHSKGKGIESCTRVSAKAAILFTGTKKAPGGGRLSVHSSHHPMHGEVCTAVTVSVAWLWCS